MSRYKWCMCVADAVRAIESGEKSVIMWQTIPSDEEVKKIADAVRRSTSLELLFLSGKRITDVGATALASAVARSPSLQVLDLSYNNITGVGASALANAVVLCSSLQALYLVSNQITDAGAVALADAMRRSPSLEKLFLHSNFITDVGALAMADAVVRRNKTIDLLDLTYRNNITVVGGSALKDAFPAQRVARATVWLACAPSGPVWLFFQKDGDRAVWSAVASFLVE